MSHVNAVFYLPPSQLFPQNVRRSDIFVPLVVVLEVDEGMCDRFCKALNLCIFNRHSHLCCRLPQQLSTSDSDVSP